MSASKVIIVTGASRGIGLAIANYLLKESHKLVLVARSAGPLEELKAQYPGQVEYQAGDLSDFSLAKKTIDFTLQKYGHIDSVILNHGVLDPIARLADSSAEEWRKSFDINFFSVYEFVRLAIPHLRSTKGRVVTTSSGAAVHAYPAWGAYCAGKAAMNMVVEALGAEEPEITSVAVRPGVVDTNMQVEIRSVHQEAMGEKVGGIFKELHATGKLLKPEQPGHVIAKLAVSAGKELSGKFVSWDGEEVAAFQE